MTQWHTGSSSQRCPGFDSQRLLGFSLSSIYASKFIYCNIVLCVSLRSNTRTGNYRIDEIELSFFTISRCWRSLSACSSPREISLRSRPTCSDSAASYLTAMSASRSTPLLKSTVESPTTVLEPVYQHWSSQSKASQPCHVLCREGGCPTRIFKKPPLSSTPSSFPLSPSPSFPLLITCNTCDQISRVLLLNFSFSNPDFLFQILSLSKIRNGNPGFETRYVEM